MLTIYKKNGRSSYINLVRTLKEKGIPYRIVPQEKMTMREIQEVLIHNPYGFEKIVLNRVNRRWELRDVKYSEALQEIYKNREVLASLISYDDTHKKVYSGASKQTIEEVTTI